MAALKFPPAIFCLDKLCHTLQSVPMTTETALHPTLWRTCRVLANHTRLNILSQIARKQPLTVSSVAYYVKVPLPVASQSLRALEARGLLTVRRVGRHVEYRLGDTTAAHPPDSLAMTLQAALRKNPPPLDLIFKLATAFTHPRRIEIHRLLHAGPRTLAKLHSATRIPHRALLRHLEKLETRGFVALHTQTYHRTDHPEALGRALSVLAT